MNGTAPFMPGAGGVFSCVKFAILDVFKGLSFQGEWQCIALAKIVITITPASYGVVAFFVALKNRILFKKLSSKRHFVLHRKFTKRRTLKWHLKAMK